MKRPNLLLITADQMRADCMGVAGRNIRTPNLDALASRGTRFVNAITPNVVCQPSRASILTGWLPRTHGVHDNGIDLDPATGAGGFAGSLSGAGYDSAFFGKAHFATYHTFSPTGTPECLTSSADYPADWYGPYMGFDHVEMMLVGHNWWLPQKPPQGQHYERWYHGDGQGDWKDRLYGENGGDTRGAAQTHHSRLPVAYHNSTWTADRMIDYLGRRDGERPFCAWVSFPDPHHPFDCPEPWSRLHHPDDVDLPEHRTRDFERRPWWHEKVLTAQPAGDPKLAEIRTSYSRIAPQSDEQLAEIIANTYGQIALIDHNVGRIMAALHAQGLAEDTLVVFTGDHGDWLGDHGLILKGPMHYDGLLKVPFIVSGPGVPHGEERTAPISTLDLWATFQEAAGAGGEERHSTALQPVIAGTASRDFAYNEWDLLPTRAGVALALRTVRTETAKLTVDLRSGAGELYCLDEDPHEMDNRFDDPGVKALRAELEAMIASRPDDALPEQVQVGQA